jgi:hypothetical protein
MYDVSTGVLFGVAGGPFNNGIDGKGDNPCVCVIISPPAPTLPLIE